MARSASNDCADDEVAFTLETSVTVGPAQQWRFAIGMCPAYQRAFTAHSSFPAVVGVTMGVVALVMALLLCSLAFLLRLHEKDVTLHEVVKEEVCRL